MVSQNWRAYSWPERTVRFGRNKPCRRAFCDSILYFGASDEIEEEKLGCIYLFDCTKSRP